MSAKHEESTEAPQGLEASPIGGDKLKVMSTDPKVKLITQPTDVIYSSLFEGDTTQLLPKITSFPIQIFGFFIFYFWTFSNILKILKKNKSAL